MKDAKHNTVKHGYGTHHFKDGTLYKGNFFEDQQHGQGTRDLGNGKIYDGYFSNGQF
jgi:hypothetical protein